MHTRTRIDRTILSVITQVGDFRLRYHVQDGGSTDGNWERVQWWQDQVNTGRFPIQCAGITFTSTREGDVACMMPSSRAMTRCASPAMPF